MIEMITLFMGVVALGHPFYFGEIKVQGQELIIACAILTIALTIFAFFRKNGSLGPVLILAIARLYWLFLSQNTFPHYSTTRSLKPIAENFELHLESVSTIWIAPVSKHFRHSSLFFYLQRPVKTFKAGEQIPQVGEYFVLFGDEHHEMMDGIPFQYEIVEHLVNKEDDYYLARVL